MNGIGLLSAEELEATAQWLSSRQKPTGEIPWADGSKMDPWDHVHSAMGLATAVALVLAVFRLITRR